MSAFCSTVKQLISKYSKIVDDKKLEKLGSQADYTGCSIQLTNLKDEHIEDARIVLRNQYDIVKDEFEWLPVYQGCDDTHVIFDSITIENDKDLINVGYGSKSYQFKRCQD